MNPAQIESHIRRYAHEVHSETLKQYSSGSRATRQRIIAAAFAMGLSPTNEGAQNYVDNITMIMDGYAGIEHSLKLSPLYDDLVQLIARSGTTLTPTLNISADYNPTEHIRFDTVNWDFRNDQRFQRFVPIIYQPMHYMSRVEIMPANHYRTPIAARDMARILAAGGRVGLGGHGEIAGLDVHFELWAMGSGGMRPIDAIRVGTLFGAEALGHGEDFGSIDLGKLADLQILDDNPLDDIRNTTSVSMVMVNGFLYDANTLNRIWPDRRPLPRQWWQ